MKKTVNNAVTDQPQVTATISQYGGTYSNGAAAGSPAPARRYAVIPVSMLMPVAGCVTV